MWAIPAGAPWLVGVGFEQVVAVGRQEMYQHSQQDCTGPSIQHE